MNQFDFGVKLPTSRPVEPKAREVTTVTVTEVEASVDPVYFDSGEFYIAESYATQLSAAIEALGAVSNLRVVVEGHTDSQPLSERAKARYATNYGLAYERAGAVASYLSERLGKPIDQFVTQGYGPDRPVASNDSPEGMALNRRVEIAISYEVSVATKSEISAGRQVTIDMGSSLFVEHRIQPQTLKMLAQIADVLGYEDIDSVELRIPDDGYFIERKASIMVYLHSIKRERGMADLQKLVVTPSDGAAFKTSANRRGMFEKFALTLLNFIIPSAVASEVVCLGPDLCESESLKIYVTEAVQPQHSQMGERALVFADAAKVWVTSEPGHAEPRFAVRSSNYARRGVSGLSEPVQFWLTSSFPDQISRWTISIFDANDLMGTQPLSTIESDTLIVGEPVIWDGGENAGELATVNGLRYELEIEDLRGHGYKVRGGVIPLVDPSFDANMPFPREDQTWYEAVEHENHLLNTDLPLAGDLITFHGRGLPEGGTLMIGAHRYPIGDSGVIAVKRQLAPGEYDVPIALVGADNELQGRGHIPVEIEGDYFFMVGLADLTTGSNDISGNIELLSDDYHYDGDVYVDGRLAFFLKGQVKGDVLLTAQLDTGESQLSDVFSDLDREDPRRLFKRIDPDRFYPVYGDNSRVVRDVDTQGKFYVRLDWDRSRFVWGNFNTSFTGTELAGFNRSLYGANLDYRSIETTSLGDEKHLLKVFASEPNTRAARDELVGTGGSLYYLSHADVVLGSAKVMVEVRDRKSNRARDQIELIEGQDYEIDPYQGRIILTRPLRDTAGMSVLSVIRETPLDGDEVVLVVDYEYVSSGISAGNDLTAGLRAKTWLTDHVAVGVTHVAEDAPDADFEMTGVDLTIKASDRSFLVIETGETEAGQNISLHRSMDGGLDYQRISMPSPTVDGKALTVTGQLDLIDAGLNAPGQLGFWYRDQDAGFNSLQYHNPTGDELTSYGLEGMVEVSDTMVLKARFDREDRGGSSFEDSGFQLESELTEQIRLAVEYLNQENERLGVKDDSSTIGARLSVAMSDRLATFINLQSVLDQSDQSAMEDMAGVGFSYRATEKVDLLGEAFSDGDNNGARLGMAYRYKANSSAYVNYVTENSNLGRDGLTLGQKSELTDRLRVYNEHRFDRSNRQSVEGDSYGISYDFTDDWTVDADILNGQSVVNDIRYDRVAYSLSSRYRKERFGNGQSLGVSTGSEFASY